MNPRAGSRRRTRPPIHPEAGWRPRTILSLVLLMLVVGASLAAVPVSEILSHRDDDRLFGSG